MIESLKDTSVFKSVNLLGKSHAYLFYSNDKELNNNIALIFAKSIFCEKLCGVCPACKQFNSNSNPDLTIIDQPSIKVEDVNLILNKLSTKPISYKSKVIVILNAENINEIAQNKLLKSLEEPNQNIVFILTTVKTDKILPTILSRLNKVYIPKLTTDDKQIISKELRAQNVIMENYLNIDLPLTDILNLENNSNFKSTLNAINLMLRELKTSADIPVVVSKLPNDIDKNLFLPMLQDVFLDCLKCGNKYDKMLIDFIRVTYSEKAIIKILTLIEDAYIKQTSNVNFGYILDNLLFNILKEKFLCK